MANYSRTDRISEEVKRELSAVIRDLKDPRLPVMTSVVSVKVTKDLKFAKAYISIMGDEKTVSGGFARRRQERLARRYFIYRRKFRQLYQHRQHGSKRYADEKHFRLEIGVF